MFHHYSALPVAIDTGVEYAQMVEMKPTGFWFTPDGVEDSWKDFCEAENFALHRFKHRFDFNLDTKDILIIDTPEGIDEFAEEYQWEEESVFTSIRGMDMVVHIDWGKVAEKYKGIIISPYQWSRRSGKHLWYYGWDCASGCVWDLSVIKDIPLLEYKGG